MLQTKFILIYLMLFIAGMAFSQTRQIRFKRLDINDGLSLSSVYCIFQDSKGFMWFGTEDGLNRYDGRLFRIFRNIPDNPNSISYKWIDLIYEDKHGILWFGSRGGLTRFDPKFEQFTRYKNRIDDQESLLSDTVTVIFEDQNDFLWVGSLHGLNRINLKTNKISRIDINGNLLSGLKSRINNIVGDDDKNLWIATDQGMFFYDSQNGNFSKIGLDPQNIECKSLVIEKELVWVGTANGLIRYNRKSKASKQFPILESTENPVPSQRIEKLLLDRQNRLWIGTIQGLYLLDENIGKAEQQILSTDQSNSQAINPIKSIFEDSSGNIWYGSFGDGLFKIDLSGNISNYRNNTSDVRSLSYNSIHSIYEDGSGNIWFGTFGAGISIYVPQSHKFDLITNDPSDNNSLSGNFVWTVLEANDGSIWIGTNSTGISRYFPKINRFEHYTFDPQNPKSLSSNKIRKIFQDSRGNIWISTDGGGLNKYLQKTNNFRHYRNIPDDSTSLSNNAARTIFEDKDGMLWIGTRNGLNCMNPETEKFTRYLNSPGNPNSLSHNYVYSGIYQDKEGNLWIGTMGGGLNKFDIQTKTFKSYRHDDLDAESISDNTVFWIYEDKKGMFWIATNSMLNQFDPKTEKFRKFGVKQGLPNEVIYGMLPDSADNLWLSTNYGLCRFNINTFKTENFDVSDGLQSNEFNGGALHLGKSGLMYFAGIYGLNIVDPKKIYKQSNVSKIAITGFQIYGIEVKIAPSQSGEIENRLVESGKEYYLNESISFTDKIILDHNQNVLSFEFSALNVALPEKVQYAYMMENLDKDWNYCGNRNFVSYAKLKPGTYVFKVKSQNGDGLWSSSIAQIQIIIRPPFWKSWWFIIIEVLIFTAIILFIYRYLLDKKMNRLLKDQNEQIRLSNIRLSESEQNLKKLNDTKDKFFSIISHDLKNPFTSLMSMSEVISDSFHSFNEEDKLSVFQKINQSLKHINILLNNLLTWSRLQSGHFDFSPVNFNLSKIIEINVNLYRQASEKKGIAIETNISEEMMVFADMEMIDTVIRNLLNNAIKFSQTGNTITIDTQNRDKMLEVQIKDQGVGISAEDLNKLFRIDIKFKAKGTSGELGTGLGLILCKEFIEKNKGEIWVDSSPGAGSVFYFTIPLAAMEV